MRGNRQKILNNKGVTLVELLVSMALLAIVLVIVASFLSMGSRSYSRANDEIKIQMKTQTVMNQLEDLIVESYWVTLVNVNTQVEALIIYAQNDISIIMHDSNNNNLYLVDGSGVDMKNLAAITYTEEENLMAGNVSDLKLFYDEHVMKTKKELQLEVDFEIASKNYPQIRTIHFRNQLVKPTGAP